MILLGTGLLASCSSRESDLGRDVSSASDSHRASLIILSVEGTDYTRGDFERYLSLRVGEETSALSEVVLSRLFDSFVEEKLLLAGAKEWLHSISPLESEEGSEGPKALSNQQLIEHWTETLKTDISLDPQEIKEHYDQHKRDFLRPSQVRVSQILLETEDKAVQAMDMLSSGTQARFREVARQLSIGVEADKGGDMGEFELGQLPADMETVIFSLKEGEVSPVVESAYGYHIFRLDEKVDPELLSEEEAAPAIEAELKSRKFHRYLEPLLQELQTRLDWTSYPQKLAFDYQRNQDE